MLLQHTQDQAPAAKLAALVEQYLKAGGRIEQLPGPTFKPLPPRIEVIAPVKAQGVPPAAVRRYEAAFQKIIPLFQRGISISEISEATGYGRTFIYSALRYHGVEPTQPRSSEAVRKLQEYANQGYTLRYAAQCVGKTLGQARGLAKRNGIKFRRP